MVHVSHSDHRQPDRNRINLAFDTEPNMILVGCLLYAKGVDIKNLNDVVFVKCPLTPDLFEQGAYRAGRKGNTGRVHLLFAPHAMGGRNEITTTAYARRAMPLCTSCREYEQEMKNDNMVLQTERLDDVDTTKAEGNGTTVPPSTYVQKY